jgi:hypothetical protein
MTPTLGTHTMGTMVGSDDPTQPISATNAIGMAPAPSDRLRRLQR